MPTTTEPRVHSPPLVFTRTIDLAEATVISGDDGYLLVHGSETSLLSRRATGNLHEMIGLSANRFRTLSDKGGIKLAGLMPEVQAPLYAAMQGNEMVAVSITAPLAIDSGAVLQMMSSGGYALMSRWSADGRIVARKSSHKEFVVARETYRTGYEMIVDLAGHAVPKIAYHIERQICVNGATISISADEQRVPQYSADGVINAQDLAIHASAWESLDFPTATLDRLKLGARTTASLNEMVSLQNLLQDPGLGDLHVASGSRRKTNTVADDAFEVMTGDVRTRFGVASVTEIPRREQRLLATTTSVNGLFHLATELASHHAQADRGLHALHAWWNRLLARGFDLQPLATQDKPVPDFWLGRRPIVAPSEN